MLRATLVDVKSCTKTHRRYTEIVPRRHDNTNQDLHRFRGFRAIPRCDGAVECPLPLPLQHGARRHPSTVSPALRPGGSRRAVAAASGSPSRSPRTPATLSSWSAQASPACARLIILRQAGRQVVVLEARERAGGRVLTVRSPFDDGLHAEAGPIRIAGVHQAVLRTARSFGLTLTPFASSQGSPVVAIQGKAATAAEVARGALTRDLKPDDRGLDQADVARSLYRCLAGRSGGAGGDRRLVRAMGIVRPRDVAGVSSIPRRLARGDHADDRRRRRHRPVGAVRPPAIRDAAPAPRNATRFRAGWTCFRAPWPRRWETSFATMRRSSG